MTERKPTHVIEASPGPRAPFATVTAGSVIIHTSYGWTRWHALGRAAKWAKRNGADGGLRVGIWSNQAATPSDTDEGAGS